MNSLELAYQLRRMSIDSSSSGSCSVPPSPEMLSASMMSDSSCSTQEFELDCSRFESISPTPSFASSFNSLSSAHHTTDQGMSSGLSRSRCAHNFSSLCSTSSAGSTSSTRQMVESGPIAGWGYFVDTTSR
mmetsp:Transcript_38360/g.62766  ORF Transcript_38360/g.62766 Transcript_38360/m.62766 type:complete len:131 (-) Transcript_38360:515-907(-)